MANPVVRMTAFYLNGKKAFTVNSVGYKIDPRRSPMFGQAGLLTHSKGAVTVGFDIKEVTPIGGSSISDLNKKIINQEDIDCAIIIAGKLHRVSCACTGAGFEGNAESGTATGDASLMGPIPTIEG